MASSETEDSSCQPLSAQLLPGKSVRGVRSPSSLTFPNLAVFAREFEEERQLGGWSRWWPRSWSVGAPPQLGPLSPTGLHFRFAQVCDEPHPLLVKEMIQHCVNANIDEAYKVGLTPSSQLGVGGPLCARDFTCVVPLFLFLF